VVTLVDGALPAGRHRAVWDGVDRRGGAVAGGIYFVKFAVFGENGLLTRAQVRKIVIVR